MLLCRFWLTVRTYRRTTWTVPQAYLLPGTVRDRLRLHLPTPPATPAVRTPAYHTTTTQLPTTIYLRGWFRVPVPR